MNYFRTMFSFMQPGHCPRRHRPWDGKSNSQTRNEMAQEIERKFMVAGDFRPLIQKTIHIMQGYLSSIPGRTVRIRTAGDKGYITIKGKTDGKGMRRFEWEKEISLSDAEELLQLCEPGIIEKKRHIIKAGKHIFEVDEFFRDNAGLIIAEIELSHEDEAFEKPEWLGKEVTADPRYYNSYLKKFPYSTWEKKDDAELA